MVPGSAPILRHPPPLARSRWHMGEQTSGTKQIDENGTNKINKNQAAVAPLWLYPVERELCSLPDDATINEIPVIDCFKLLWRLETGQSGQDRRRKREILLSSASEPGAVYETNACWMPRDGHCSKPTWFYLLFLLFNPNKYALFWTSFRRPPPSAHPPRKITARLDEGMLV